MKDTFFCNWLRVLSIAINSLPDEIKFDYNTLFTSITRNCFAIWLLFFHSRSKCIRLWIINGFGRHVQILESRFFFNFWQVKRSYFSLVSRGKFRTLFEFPIIQICAMEISTNIIVWPVIMQIAIVKWMQLGQELKTKVEEKIWNIEKWKKMKKNRVVMMQKSDDTIRSRRNGAVWRMILNYKFKLSVGQFSLHGQHIH